VPEVSEVVMDEVSAFLCQIPPDWDKAEQHAKANLVIDNT